MRKSNPNFLLLVCICISFSYCKKEVKPLNHDGIVFYPTKFFMNSFSLSGIKFNSSTIEFAYGIKPEYFTAVGRINYNIADQAVNITEIDYGGTDKLIRGLIPLGEDKFAAYHFDEGKYKIDSTYGNWVYYITVLILDKNLNVLNEKKLPVGAIGFRNPFSRSPRSTNIHLKALNNGNVIMSIAEGIFWSQNTLICFDQDLNFKWEVNVENTTNASNDYAVKDILVKNDGIYLLQNKINLDGTYDQYRIKKYDYNGNLVYTSKNSLQGQEGVNLLQSDNGVMVVGTAFNAATQKTTFFSECDLNMNQLSTNFIGGVNYVKFYPVKYNSAVVSSNVLQCNNAYYFMTLEYQLVKLNKSFEIEWVKTIDKFSVSNNTNDRYLVNVGDNIVCIGQNNWNGADGITFLKMDFEGNIVR